MNIIIVASSSAINYKSKSFSIGGVQTYIQDLLKVGEILNANCVLALICNENSSTKLKIDGINVQSFHKKEILKSLNQSTFDHIYNKFNSKDAIFVIATDQMSIKSSANNVITIQHGIAFDDELKSVQRILGHFTVAKEIYAHLRAAINVRRGRCTKNIVCVDYNFFNWIRTLGDISKSNNYHIILNHTSGTLPVEVIKKKIFSQREIKRIIFARRFVDYRGTIIFANVIENLFKRGYNFGVTFAGEGPLETSLKERFATEHRVDFLKFLPQDSVTVHSNYDIAIVPTISSEGSSLSLSEAMAAGCLPIATHVGGMTNMIIDGYNGFFCYPREKELESVLEKVLCLNSEDFKEIQLNAYNTASKSFNLQKWQSEWMHLFREILANN